MQIIYITLYCPLIINRTNLKTLEVISQSEYSYHDCSLQMVLLSHPCVIQYDGNCPLRDYWIKVGKGTQNSHQQSKKADTGQYNFLSLENQLEREGSVNRRGRSRM